MKQYNLKILLQSYKRYNKPNLEKVLNYYKCFNTIDDALKAAGLSYTVNEKRHPHQRRLNKQVLANVANNFLFQKQEFQKAINFETIYELVESCSELGFGPLAKYDAALRIGAYLGVYPESVYFHAGTLKGAVALKINCEAGKSEPNNFPEEIQALEPYEIEDFLCIYKNELA